MLKILALFILYLQIIRCAHICKEDGLFENSDDRTSYFECIDGKRHFRSCPLAEDRQSYKVFDGQTCVDLYPEFVCPQESGKYRYLDNQHKYYLCVNSEPLLRDCPPDTTFDGLECVLPSTTQNESLEDKFLCPEPHGLFYNPVDKHSYYECTDSEFTVKYCARERKSHKISGQHKHHFRRRGVFDGEKCIPAHHYDNPKDSRQSRQAPPDIAPDYQFTCPEADGYFADPRDPHNYFICSSWNPREERCPPNRRFNDTIKQCTYAPAYQTGPDASDLPQTYPIIGNGPTCPAGYLYDSNTGVCRSESMFDIDIVEPSCPDGSVYDRVINKCRVDTAADPRPVVVDVPTAPQCPSGSTYDSETGRCILYGNPIVNAPVCPHGTYDRDTGRCISYVDPVVNHRPIYINRNCPSGSTYDSSTGTCVSYVDPIANRPPCPLGSVYDSNTRGCVGGGRYRRNARVETEDTYSGAVIVDTWNEKEWKWERNSNGNRILPDVNGWLDRSYAFRRANGSPFEFNK